LSTITDADGVKTFSYNPDGTLAAIAGSGAYPTKTFGYTGGVLTSITVS
jgi:hypothetical protein